MAAPAPSSGCSGTASTRSGTVSLRYDGMNRSYDIVVPGDAARCADAAGPGLPRSRRLAARAGNFGVGGSGAGGRLRGGVPAGKQPRWIRPGLLRPRDRRRAVARRRRRVHRSAPRRCRGRPVHRPNPDLRDGDVERRHVRVDARVRARRPYRRRRAGCRRPPAPRLRRAGDADHRHARHIRPSRPVRRERRRPDRRDRPVRRDARWLGTAPHVREGDRDTGHVMGRVLGDTQRMQSRRP